MKNSNPVGCASVLLVIAMLTLMFFLMKCKSEEIVIKLSKGPVRGIEVKCDSVCKEINL